MSIGFHNPAIVAASSVLILVIIVAVVSSFWPRQEDFFFELGLLGNNKTADAYFYNQQSIFNVNVLNDWFIYVHNHMDAAENVSIRVKLLNSTMNLPNDLEHIPATTEYIAEFPLSLSINETSIIPFSWSVTNVESKDNLVVIKNLQINGRTVEVQVSDFESSFRIVFELLVKNSNSQNYVFGWESKESFFSASVYMGFKLGFDV
jgi:hypothetical protein